MCTTAYLVSVQEGFVDAEGLKNLCSFPAVTVHTERDLQHYTELHFCDCIATLFSLL
jgi:hypothetical protein